MSGEHTDYFVLPKAKIKACQIISQNQVTKKKRWIQITCWSSLQSSLLRKAKRSEAKNGEADVPVPFQFCARPNHSFLKFGHSDPRAGYYWRNRIFHFDNDRCTYSSWNFAWNSLKLTKLEATMSNSRSFSCLSICFSSSYKQYIRFIKHTDTEKYKNLRNGVFFLVT